MKNSLLIFIAFFVCALTLQAKKNGTKRTDSYSFTRGMEALESDNYEEALDWFNKDLTDNPENGYAYLAIASIRNTLQEYGQALYSINQAIKFLPKKANDGRAIAFSTRADINLTLNDTVKALEDYTQALRLDPTNKHIWNQRAQLYFEKSDYFLSDADYLKMTELDAGDAMGYMGVGRNANMQKHWDDAIKQFNFVIKLFPNYSNVYSFRAEAYIGKELWNEATDDIIKALEIDGDQKAFFLMQNMPEEATSTLKAKMRIQMTKQPTNEFWPFCLGNLAQNQKNYTEAINYYIKSNDIYANSVSLENIARCYLSLEDNEHALEYVDKAQSLNPDDFDLINLRAEILSNLERFDECLAERSRYIAHFPEDSFAYIMRAEDLMSYRQYKDAAEDYTVATVLFPRFSDFPYLLMKRGDAYRLTGNLKEAAANYNHLLEVEKDSVLNSNSRTPFAYSGLGNAEKAIETMEYILNNDTTDVKDNLYNAACIYARLGQNSKAIEYLQKAIDKGYNSKHHISCDYDLDGLRALPEFKSLIESIQINTIPIIDVDKVIAEVLSLENIERNSHESDETTSLESVEVPFTKESGVTKVKCLINDLPLHFVFDTGASNVTLSMVEANFMLKNGYIKPTDIIGSATYIDANGDLNEGTIINLSKVNFGGLELDNVRASVVRNQKAPLLLGQSVLGRLGKIEIDNSRQKLIITHRHFH